MDQEAGRAGPDLSMAEKSVSQRRRLAREKDSKWAESACGHEGQAGECERLSDTGSHQVEPWSPQKVLRAVTLIGSFSSGKWAQHRSLCLERW